ncbi:MAG: hydrogenase maturation protease, partial [Candidatus Bipolaricaulota bacterium]
ATGGVPLIEQMVGYDRVLLVDAFLDADRGDVVMLTPDSLTNKESFSGVHDMDLVSSLQAIRSVYGGQLPPDEQIFIYGIGIDKTTKFSEGLSEEVEEAVQEVVDSVISDLSASSEVGYES